MPIPKVRTGRLAPDQEALDYYDTPVKHWTHTDWDQIDMSKVDIGLHSDPTPAGLQAADRRMYHILGEGRGDDVTKDMRIHVGNAIVADDIGRWDNSEMARRGILDALSNDDWELGERFAEDFPKMNISGSTRDGKPQMVEDMAAMRQWLLDNDIQTIAYRNAEEGREAVADAATTNPEWLAFEEEQLGKIQALRMDAARAEADGDFGQSEAFDIDATMLEDELEYARDEAIREAEDANISYISLDPGNVRSADAAFQKDMIGKPDMMGSATTPMLGALAGLGATGSVLASQSPRESLSQGWEALKGLGEAMHNDVSRAAEGVHYGLTGDRMTAPRADWGEETPLGNALAQDFGEYVSGIDLNPFPGEYTFGQALTDVGDAYNQYLKPHLSERQEAGLGGGALLASMIGVNPAKGASHLKRVGDYNKLKQAEVTGGALVDAQKVDPYSLVDRPYVSNMADTSAGDNSIITSIGGVPVNVNREGGFDFMRQPQNVDEGRLWASDKNAVTGILNAAEESMALPGARGKPIMLPWSMTPGRSSDFGHFSADLATQYSQQVMNPVDMKALDQRIRRGTGNLKNDAAPVEDWIGLANVTPEYLQTLGGKRKNALRAMDEYRKLGALDQSSVRHAVADRIATESYIPAQVLRVGEIDLKRGMLDDSRHTTYNRGVAGRYLGNLNPGASILDDPKAQLRSGINLRDRYGPRGEKLPSPQGKAMQSNVIGVLTEDIIEDWIRKGVFD